MKTKQVNDVTLDEVLSSNKLVLVDFWAPWCGPCRMIAPVLEKLSVEVGEKAVIAKLNVDESPISASQYRIQSIPTMKLFINGREAETIIGLQPYEKLKALLLRYAS